MIWYCKHCINYHCANTTTVRSHLLSKHDIRIEESRQLVISKEKAMLNILGPSDVSSVECINEALLQLVIRYDFPFRAIEWPKIYVLLTIQYPKIGKGILSSYSSISKKINSIWLSAKDDLRIRLQSSLSMIHFAADIWISPNRILFFGLCIYFVDRESLQLVRIFLGFRPILTYRREKQTAEIFSLFEDFRILLKIGYFIGDNYLSNDVLYRFLESRFKRLWDIKQYRLRYYSYIVNLVVQAFLFESYNNNDNDNNDNDDKFRQIFWRQRSPLGKLYNIAIYICGFLIRYKEFVVFISRGLPFDNETKWNN